jgi:hypothetical protein
MRPVEKSDRADPNALRITMQYHHRKGMVYELENAGLTLDVHVAPDQTGESFDSASHWLVGAQSSRAQDAVVITERAATRTEALRLVGQTWTACARERNLPLFDWSAVEKVLLSVRAL